jgi:protoporphyrinogen oxidase
MLARLLEGAPPEVVEASGRLDSRAMVLIYVELPCERFTEYDAHYFPAAATRITRLSEPKNYAARAEPANRTVLCAELPCARGDAVWRMDEAGLEALLAEDLERSGIPLPSRPVARHVERLAQAYPIYARGYEQPFELLEHWALGLPQFLTYGRQGLFAHDNTHHALFMAYRAADCLNGGAFDQQEWARWREVFDTHVVED